MARDWVAQPELRDSEMDVYYWASPHKQITENFNARVSRVHDGDTITVDTGFRNFGTTIRLNRIDTPELNAGGKEAGDFLRRLILGRDVYIEINPKNRVGKWGRIIGEVLFGGENLNDLMLRTGHATLFENRKDGKIEDFGTRLNKEAKKLGFT